MSGNMSVDHLDEFTLLRYAVADLDGGEREAADDHLHACARCAASLSAMEKLDEQLRAITTDFIADDGLPAGDPFARRPEAPPRRAAAAPAREGESLAMAALGASERARAESGRILDMAKRSADELASFLSGMPLSDLSFRFALLYAMQDAGLGIAESPVRSLGLALAALGRLQGETQGDPAAPAERVLPLKALAGQAHLLAAQARNWTGELEQAREHLEQAYQDFGESTGDDLSLATVELVESQRRAFAGDPAAGLLLAQRARRTFEELELEDYIARGRTAEGISLSKIEGREEEALEAYRSALPVFHKRELWSNYLGVLSSIAACLSALGRLDEARREYARALKSVSRDKHAAWIGYVRNGLALVLFRARNYGGAALAFLQAAQLFREAGNIGNALTADLYEVECWALSGNLGRAAQRFEIFRAEVARHDALDPAILRQLAAALSGSDPNLEEVALLRESAGQQLRARFG